MSTMSPEILKLTTLPPGAPDDGDAGRRQRGLAIATRVPIKKSRAGYTVPAQSGFGTYFVAPHPEAPYCSCPDHEEHGGRCKHIYAVEHLIRNPMLLYAGVGKGEGQEEAATTSTVYRDRTYGQDWAAYNTAQAYEQEHFTWLLRELCDTIPQPQRPPHTAGRPRLLLSDVVFAIGLKVYTTLSGRRAQSSFRDAVSRGLMHRAPSFTSTFRYLENEGLTPILRNLIELSATPLRSVEMDFAVDSSGFSSTMYERWFDQKYGRNMRRGKWVKAHLICGVRTNIVTSAEVTPTLTADINYLEPLVRTTARNFDMAEVSADRAYSGRKNIAVIDELGATPYIPFKGNSKSRGPRDGVWDEAYRFFHDRREEFLAHYHKRSNVETVFHMIKAKFGPAVRTRTPVAQVNEVLTKILCHNICVVIQSAYEYGVQPVFGPRPGLRVAEPMAAA